MAMTISEGEILINSHSNMCIITFDYQVIVIITIDPEENFQMKYLVWMAYTTRILYIKTKFNRFWDTKAECVEKSKAKAK